MPHDPLVAVLTGDDYCQTVLHHLSLREYTDIKKHLRSEFAGVPGTRNSDWSQATGPLGFLLIVFGSGMGTAHVDIVPMTSGIFKYP